MELYTLDRQFAQQDTIDYFTSAIWTERVSGNDDFQLSAVATPSHIKSLAVGVYVGLKGSDVVMIIDDQTVQNGILIITGTSLTQNLNRRFVRFSAGQQDKSINIAGSPGYIMQYLVQNMAIDGNWLNGVQPTGIVNPTRLKIPSLTIGDYDNTLPSITAAVPYGPLYDALKQLADTYFLGMKIAWYGINDIRFRVYLGVDRTSTSINSLVRFSPDYDNFGNTKEVVSAKNFKTHAFAFGSGITTGGPYAAGEVDIVGGDLLQGFDLRATLVFADDITVSDANLANTLAQRAQRALVSAQIIGAVDGEISSTAQYVFGTHYNLGDIVETQGSSGVIQASRVTEYIRAQDASGTKAYPTFVAV